MWYIEVFKGVGGNIGDKFLFLIGEFFLFCLGVFIIVFIIFSILIILFENKINYNKYFIYEVYFIFIKCF